MSNKSKKHQTKEAAASSVPTSTSSTTPDVSHTKATKENKAQTSTTPDISFLPVFVQRVTPTVVSSLLSTAIGYYETSKAKYPQIAAAENNLIKLSSPVIEKVKPAINGLDQFGCKQLDKFETQMNNSKKKIDSSIYKPAEQALETTKTFVYNNIVNTKPINQVLEITEYAVDKVLPSTNKKTAEEPISTGTLDANVRFTRLRSKTMDKLKSLIPISEEKLKSFTHSNSLIEYASKYIDVNHTVEEVKEFAHAPIQKSKEYVITSVNYVRTSKVTQSVESVAKEGIHKAVTAGQSAISYIPKPVLDKVENTYSVIIIKVPFAKEAISTVQYYLSPLMDTTPPSVPSDD